MAGPFDNWMQGRSMSGMKMGPNGVPYPETGGFTGYYPPGTPEGGANGSMGGQPLPPFGDMKPAVEPPTRDASGNIIQGPMIPPQQGQRGLGFAESPEHYQEYLRQQGPQAGSIQGGPMQTGYGGPRGRGLFASLMRQPQTRQMFGRFGDYFGAGGARFQPQQGQQPNYQQGQGWQMPLPSGWGMPR